MPAVRSSRLGELRAMPGVAVVTGSGTRLRPRDRGRLARRGYACSPPTSTRDAAAATAEEIGGVSMQLDVRDPEAHRAAARAAAERGPLEVWVNNAGVHARRAGWEHSDDEVRLICEVDMLGVIWGSLAAVDAMRERRRATTSCNIGSLAALGPVPGLSMYAGGEARRARLHRLAPGRPARRGIPITVHVSVPGRRRHAAAPRARPRAGRRDQLVRARAAQRGRGGRARRGAARLEEARARRPAWRGWGARVMSMAGRQALRAAPILRKQGDRHRVAFRSR